MKCLIVAAGQGVRLRGELELKPLVKANGTPLIEHVIGRARRAGVEEFVVVSGYRGDELRRHLEAFASAQGVRIAHVKNESWHIANGVSVLRARDQLAEPFLLTMCDHLVDPDLIRNLMDVPHDADGVTLAVDHDLRSPLVDIDDVTKVRTRSGQIERIGKSITDYDCFDTGIFRCTPAMFDALEESGAGGDHSISGAMNVLARRGRALAFDIGQKTWIDVDDLRALAQAERLLAEGRL